TIEGDPVRRAVHYAYQFLPAFDRSHDLLGPTADRRAGIVWVQRETHAGLLGLRNYGLEEIGDIGPHFVERMGPLFCERRKILHPFVIKAGPARASAPVLFEIALHRPVRVPVTFDNWQADLTGNPDRAAAAATSFEPAGFSGDPPSAASRQIFGVSFPSKRGPPRAAALEVPDNDKADAPQVAGIARAATPAVLRTVLRDGLFMRLTTRGPRQRATWKLTTYSARA